jgi:glycosyltransferase involved in cell wall biosynthesis
VQPSIGVIIPVFNGVAFIERCLRSVLAQTRQPQRIVVVDDCSTDGTVAFVRSRFGEASVVEIVSLEKNGGPSAARNFGAKRLDTDVIAFLDADDAWLPHHLARIQHAFEVVPPASVVFSSVVRACSPASAHERPASALKAPLVTLLRENRVPQSAVAVRRELLIRANGYNEAMRYAEDFDLWLRLARGGAEFAWTGAESCVRYEHDNQVSVRFVERMFRAAWGVRAVAVEGLPDIANDQAIASALLAAARNDLESAWNSRRRSAIRCVLDVIGWVPHSAGLMAAWNKRVGWQWPFWRAASMVYDALPESVLSPIRRHRARSLVAAGGENA